MTEQQPQTYLSWDDFINQAEPIDLAFQANQKLLKAQERQVRAIERGGVQPNENTAYEAALANVQKTKEKEIAINHQFDDLAGKLSPEDQKRLEDAQAEAQAQLQQTLGGLVAVFGGNLDIEGAANNLKEAARKAGENIRGATGRIEGAARTIEEAGEKLAKAGALDTLTIKNGYGEISLDDKSNCVIIKENGHDIVYDLNGAKASTVNGLIKDANNDLDLMAFGSWNEWFQNKYALYEGQITPAEYDSRMKAAVVGKIDPRFAAAQEAMKGGGTLKEQVDRAIAAMNDKTTAPSEHIEHEPQPLLAITPASEDSVCRKR